MTWWCHNWIYHHFSNQLSVITVIRAVCAASDLSSYSTNRVLCFRQRCMLTEHIKILILRIVEDTWDLPLGHCWMFWGRWKHFTHFFFFFLQPSIFSFNTSVHLAVGFSGFVIPALAAFSSLFFVARRFHRITSLAFAALLQFLYSLYFFTVLVKQHV